MERQIEPIKLTNGEALLILVKDGRVIHFTWDMALTHIEFVKRSAGELPQGAWVGTVRKDKKELVAISSKSFYGYQLPAPDWVMEAVKNTFK